MAFFNPIQLIATLFLALVALPLAFLACITTWLACWILVTRLLFVYAELAWEIVRYTLYDRWRPGHYIESPSVSRRSSRAVSPIGSPPRSPEFSSFKGAPRSRRRAGSISSNASAVPRVAFSGATTILEPNPNALERDFEGLGGWVIRDGADDPSEQAWNSLNPRLEPRESHRHHSRAHTVATPLSGNYTFGSPARSGRTSVSHSPERLTTTGLSPRSPGSRTPTRVRVGALTHLERSDSYFPLQAQLKKIAAG